MRPTLPRNVRILGLTSLLNDVASEMVYPLLPQFLLEVLGGNRLYLGLVEGVAETAASLLKLVAGAWSDRAGRRKPFVLIGYLLAGLARPVTGFALQPWHVLSTRLADRIGKGIRTAPRDALISTSSPPAIRGRAFGFHRAMDHLGAAIGPLLAAAYLAIWPDQLRTLFVLTLIPGALVLLLLSWGLREPPTSSGSESSAEPGEHPLGPTSQGTSILSPVRPVLPGRFWFFLAAVTLFTLGNSSDAFLLVRAHEVGVPTAQLPLLWCAFHLAKSGGNLFSGRLVDRLGPRPLLVGGWFGYGLIYLGFAIAQGPIGIWAMFLAYGLTYALTEPAEKTLVSRLVGPSHVGLAFGWFNLSLGIAALPASLIFGWVYEQWGVWAAFGWGASLAMVAGVAIAFVSLAPPPAAE